MSHRFPFFCLWPHYFILKHYFKYYYFLVLAIVLFAAATVVQRYSNSAMKQVNKIQELKKIQTNTAVAFKEAENDASKIAKIIKENTRLSFSILVQPTRYPYYILRDGNLYFWSTNQHVPEQNIFADTSKYKYVEEKQSKFLRYYIQAVGTDKAVYKLYFLIPLFSKSSIQNDYIASSFNNQIFNPNLETVIHSNTSNDAIVAPNQVPLFSIFFSNTDNWVSTNIQQIIFMLTLAYLLSIVAYGTLWAKYFFKEKQYFKGISSAFILIIFIRIILLQFNFPYSIIAFDLFNSKFFASSIISPSLGDFVFNAVAVFIGSLLLFRYFFKLSLAKKILQIKGYFKHCISFLLIAASQLIYGLVYAIFRIINQHSQWIFDITTTIDFNYFRSFSLLVFVLISISFFCINHLLLRLYLTLNKQNLKIYIFIAALGSLVTPIIFWGDKNFYWPLVAVNFIFISLQYQLHMPRFLSKIRYSSYVYFIAVSIMCALAGSLAIYKINVQRTVVDKNKFASQVLIESDVLEEYLLHDIHEKIKNDVFIRNIFASPLTSKDLIFQKIKRIFLANYFEKFDIKIALYNPYGDSYFGEENYPKYNDAVKTLAKKNYSTEYKNIFFIKTSSNQDLPRYVVFNKVEKNGIPVGYILLQLNTKKIIPYSVFPELLVDKKYSSLNQPKSYSYAIFSKGEMQSNYGLVNYEKDFPKLLLSNTALYNEGLNIGKLHHIGFKDSTSNTIIVVSSESYSWIKIFSNFSFLFILFLLLISAYLFGIRLFSKEKNVLVSYASKIQIYLNVAFFLPLFVIAVTTLSVISTMYQNNLNLAFVKKAENIGNRISIFFEDYTKEKIKKENLNSFVLQLARFTETDINFYNGNGLLVSSNQALIYQKGLLSKYLNPEAMSEIKERKNNMIMLTEQVGNLHYHSVYLAVKAYDSGKLLGILSIPFFESRQELEKQIIQVLTTIINIFSSIFIVFLMLSYIVSRALTVPLKLITHSIKKTSFGNTNEPINWESKDELGLLVGEYNAMLQKLETSKDALRSSEKENAWREMAQQVAHEIKNPLTPMKLTIQYLTQNILNDKDVAHEKINKGLVTILNQIETLNEIATSFASFAKMPVPKNELFDIVALLQNSANLFNNTVENIKTIALPAKAVQVYGDPQIMNAIFSNILLNAVQSIPNDRLPHIAIIGQMVDKSIILEFKDNGIGIPQAMQHKVFAPHFSTKYTGSGIGLSLAKQGVEHVGGKIWFVSEPDKGTSFFIQLPLA